MGRLMGVPLVNIPELKDIILFHERHNENRPGCIGIPRHSRRRKDAESVMIIMTRERQLLEVVGAAHAIGGLPYFLHGWQKEANQDGDDGDDD
jgi:hypothetical protein